MRNRDDNRGKKPNWGSAIGVIIALAMFSPELLTVVIMVGILVIPIWLAVTLARKSGGKKQEERFGECPKPICFHSDKAEHHIRRGREIDPWDRPDIDIRKYQRK